LAYPWRFVKSVADLFSLTTDGTSIVVSPAGRPPVEVQRNAPRFDHALPCKFSIHSQELWAEWEGREQDFYRACAQLVSPLAREQVEKVCGPRVRILAGLLRDAYVHLTSEAIPERLQLSEFRISGVEGNGFRVVGYSPYDPLIMPESLARVLHYFDGRFTEEALEAIFKEQGLQVDLSLVRRMVDFGLLRSCIRKNKNLLPVLK
jgi:hypothetical protein